MEPPFTTLEKGARTMKTLTGMNGMGNARELAEMLRQMGRGRDTVLAHITPEEAQMLMEMGGSGKINPNTGLPEFQDEFDLYSAVSEQQAEDPFYQEPSYEDSFAYETMPLDTIGMAGQQEIPTIDVTGGQQQPPVDMGMDIGFGPGRFAPEYRPQDVAGMPPDQFQRMIPAEPGMAQQLESKLGGISDLAKQYPRLAQLAGYSAQGLVGLLQAARARRQGREEAKQFSRLGEPMRAQGEALRTQALSGTLTPQQAAQQEAQRARLRQTAATRGVTTGTQAGMIENQLARSRSELSQTNLNNALKMLNLANAYDEAAIKAKIASDREADDYLSQIFANIGGQVASAAPTQRTPRTTQQTPEITRRPELPRGEQ